MSKLRLLEAIDLMEFGIQMMRQNIVRKYPEMSEMQDRHELSRWIFEQPSAKQIDSDYSTLLS